MLRRLLLSLLLALALPALVAPVSSIAPSSSVASAIQALQIIPDAHASYSLDGATTSLDNTSGTVPFTAAPGTIVCWYKPAAIGITVTLFGLNTSSGGNHQFELVINSSNQAQAEARDTSSSQATTTGTVTNGAWNMAGAVYTSTTSRAAYLNGELGTGGTPTVTRAPTGMNEIHVGKSRSGAGAFNQFANGLESYCWVWAAALSEANLDSLCNLSGGTCLGGVLPSTVGTVAFRTDLRGNVNPEVDTIAGVNLTVTAATFSSDDPFSSFGGGGGTVCNPIAGRCGGAAPPVIAFLPRKAANADLFMAPRRVAGF